MPELAKYELFQGYLLSDVYEGLSPDEDAIGSTGKLICCQRCSRYLKRDYDGSLQVSLFWYLSKTDIAVEFTPRRLFQEMNGCTPTLLTIQGGGGEGLNHRSSLSNTASVIIAVAAIVIVMTEVVLPLVPLLFLTTTRSFRRRSSGSDDLLLPTDVDYTSNYVGSSATINHSKTNAVEHNNDVVTNDQPALLVVEEMGYALTLLDDADDYNNVVVNNIVIENVVSIDLTHEES